MRNWKSLIAAGALSLSASLAHAATEIELFFPVPVEGKLAAEMKNLIDRFNAEHADIDATAVCTGSYDETNIKTRAAIKTGRPPAAVIMSANFILEYQINGEIEPFDGLIEADGLTADAYMDRFWPALHGNARFADKVWAAPFHNSTPLLYSNKEHFAAAGLDPDAPPATWQAMSNGGQYYNAEYGGEVHYDTQSMLGALSFVQDLIFKHKVTPEGVTDGKAVSTAFFAGDASMVMLSTGSLSFIRENMGDRYGVAFVPRNVRNAVAIGGASLMMPKGQSDEQKAASWTLINWLTSPEISGHWSRFTGYFAPNKAAYDMSEMKGFLEANPDAQVALDQLAYARSWFATFNTVAVRKALEDEVQAVMSGDRQPAEALAAAQAKADEIMRPYVEQTALKLPQ